MVTNNETDLPETADVYICSQINLLTTYDIQAIQHFLGLATEDERDTLFATRDAHEDHCICIGCDIMRQYDGLTDTYTDLKELLPEIKWTITKENCHQIFRRDFRVNERLALAKIKYVLEYSPYGFNIIHQLVSQYAS